MGTEIRKIDHTCAREEVDLLYDFCRKLTEIETNGFGWPIALMAATSINEFLHMLAERKKQECFNLQNLRRGFVPQELWWILDDSGIIGLSKLRWILTPSLLRLGGHIGIGLIPEARGKGCGTSALELVMGRAFLDHDLEEVLLTTHVSNSASRHMVEKCGGELWDVITLPSGQEEARYWAKTH